MRNVSHFSGLSCSRIGTIYLRNEAGLPLSVSTALSTTFQCEISFLSLLPSLVPNFGQGPDNIVSFRDAREWKWTIDSRLDRSGANQYRLNTVRNFRSRMDRVGGHSLSFATQRASARTEHVTSLSHTLGNPRRGEKGNATGHFPGRGSRNWN